MIESTCNGLCSLWKTVDYTIGAGAYASGYVGGSIPSVIAKGVEGVARGCYKFSQLLAHTDESGNRHGLLYEPVAQAAGVVLAGVGISYAGYKLCKGQPLIIQSAWANVGGGAHHLKIPPLSTFLRVATGATLMASGALMVLNTFYNGTWGVERGPNSGDRGNCHELLSRCQNRLMASQTAPSS